MFYKNPLILSRATSLATVMDNGISTRGEEMLQAGIPPARRAVSCFFSSGERSPYRSAAHNATERAISFLHPFLLEHERKVVRV